MEEIANAALERNLQKWARLFFGAAESGSAEGSGQGLNREESGREIPGSAIALESLDGQHGTADSSLCNSPLAPVEEQQRSAEPEAADDSQATPRGPWQPDDFLKLFTFCPTSSEGREQIPQVVETAHIPAELAPGDPAIVIRMAAVESAPSEPVPVDPVPIEPVPIDPALEIAPLISFDATREEVTVEQAACLATSRREDESPATGVSAQNSQNPIENASSDDFRKIVGRLGFAFESRVRNASQSLTESSRRIGRALENGVRDAGQSVWDSSRRSVGIPAKMVRELEVTLERQVRNVSQSLTRSSRRIAGALEHGVRDAGRSLKESSQRAARGLELAFKAGRSRASRSLTGCGKTMQRRLAFAIETGRSKASQAFTESRAAIASLLTRLSAKIPEVRSRLRVTITQFKLGPRLMRAVGPAAVLSIMAIFGILTWKAMARNSLKTVAASTGIARMQSANGEQAGPVLRSHEQITDPGVSLTASSLSRYEIGPLRRQAKYGDGDAAFLLGMAYEMGYGVPKSCAKAAEWVTMSAGEGNAAAEFNLGLRYKEGDGLPADPGKAMDWLEKAAVQNYGQSRSELSALRIREAQDNSSRQ
jgi:TPR repeat protein